MKRILFVFIFSVISISSVCAQYVQFGISIGMEVSKYAVYYDFIEAEIQPKIGFRVALEADFYLANGLYLVPELVFTQRGTSSIIEDYNDAGTYKLKTKYTENLNCLQVPVNVMYKLEVNDEMLLCAFAGPYVGWFISGKAKNLSNRNKDELLTFGYKRGELKPIDLGFSFGIGIEYMDLLVRAQYNHGLTNLLNGENVNSQRNRNIGVSLGFLF
jgi:hypothetical protein